MENGHNLEERIAKAIDGLSPKQKRLARFVLDSKYFMSFASASQAGRKTDTSAATVVRFAQSLGYEGYSEMQAAIRAELPSYLTAVELIQARLGAPSPPEDVSQQVFYTDVRNIERTANQLSEIELDAALEEILEAKRILVIGAGLSAAPAMFLGHSLKVMGLDVRIVINEGLGLAADVAQMHPGTLLIVIDLWRYARSSVEAVSTAKKNKARSIAITDSIVSPLAKMADHAFEVSADGVAHSLSTVAVMALINVIVAKLSYRVPEKVMKAIRRVDSAYRASGLLITE